MDEPKKAVELKKHVAVIHSSNKLSLLQRKIANALLFNAYNNLMEKDEHEIHIATLCQLIDYDSNDYKTIKKSLVNLLSTVLEWNLVDGERVDSEGVWNASSIIADASIDGPICTYSYSNKMRKLLHRPNIYGRLDMLVQAKFQSSYGLALYENCNRYQDIGQSPWFDISKFRKLMGVEEGKYKVFRDFKSRVLDKAIEEVNQYAPIIVEPQLRRQNQKVVAIQFIIKKNTNGQPSEMDGQDISRTLKIKFGFSKRQIQQTLEQFSEEYIREKMLMIEASQSYKSGKIKNLAKYLLSALKDDYQPVKVSGEENKVTRITGAKLLDYSDHQQKQKIEREHEYNRFAQKDVIARFNNLPDKEKRQITKNFETFLHQSGRGIYFDIYQRDGFANPLVQDQLFMFIKNKNHKLLKQVLTFAQWEQQRNLAKAEDYL